jgi:hypothetical protein
VDSLGLASNGLQGFVATMLKTVVDLFKLLLNRLLQIKH